MSSQRSDNESKRNGLLPASKWQPAFYTPRISRLTDGDEIINFAAEHFIVLKGFRAGEPLTFTAWQKWLLRALFERDEETMRLRYRRALIGLPRKQGKSLMLSAVAVYGLITGESGAEVYVVAGDRQQARIIFGEAKQQVQMSSVLSQECKVYRDAIEMPRFGSVLRVLSSEFKGQAGLNPSLVLFDELWNQTTSDLYDQMTLGSGARIEPLVVSITTAGYDLDTVAGHLYQYGKRCAAGEVPDKSFGFWWWEAPADCAPSDEKAWRVANPNLNEKLLDITDMRTAVQQTDEAAFRRWRLNQWVRAQESWLPAGAWEQCADDRPLRDDLPIWVGIDMALKHDSIAVVLAQPQDGIVVTRAHIWQPQDEGVDVAGVEHHLRALHKQYQVREFVYDPAYFQRSAEALADDGLPMVEFPQSAARMIPACGHAYEMIVNGTVTHDGSPTYTDQVLSAAQRMTDTGWRLSKGKSKRKIDACIALVMALDRATSRPETATAAPMIVQVWN
jgi:phage terminase large subunit-like protein